MNGFSKCLANLEGVLGVRQYNDNSRGTYQREDCAKQLISFEGLKFRGRNGVYNVTPTDIDGYVQLDIENCVIFFELKYTGKVSEGQGSALSRLCDAVQAGGMHCALIVAVHSVPLPNVIIAKDAIVKTVYWKGKWWNKPFSERQITLGEIAMKFVNYKDK